MASIRLAAGSFLFSTFILVALTEEFNVHPPDLEDDDAAHPSQMLAIIHEPNQEEINIHQLSRTLLTVTKDLISYAPRTKYFGFKMNTADKLWTLQTIRPGDVRAILSQQSVTIPQARNVTCGFETQFYRTMDGSCNNLKNPCWGKADEPYLRWLPPVYANGIDEPRKMKNGQPLPSPRQVFQWVSSQFEPSQHTTYDSFSNLLVVWGQMVAHDIILTPTVTVKVWDGREFKNEKPHCCNTQTPHPECIPIVMNYEDGYFPRGHCMNIARSIAYIYSPNSCSPLNLGRTREQVNQLTPFLDASLVYGTSEKEMRSLREHGGRGAKLIMDYSTHWSFPSRKNESKCKSSSDSCSKTCFLAGEKRANENPVLAAMHTLWAREHNRLVDLLKVKGWPEETLFHVVRKIVGAMLQHTTYSEFLPIIIGPTLSSVMKLSVPSKAYKYDPSVNPAIYNVFATAAFRYGHSMVSSRHLRAGKTMENSPFLSQDFFSIDDFCNPHGDPVASLLYGQLHQKVQKVDCIFSKQLTNHLFAKVPNGEGLDLFSLNVQRGREHGIAPYNNWRQICGLPKAKDYSDLRGSIPDYVLERLQTIYGPGNVDEIDLFIGGVSELPVNDGILGPTFTCIIANQFYRLKVGDRFWYENLQHPGGFTAGQLAAIQKTTISSLLCRNSDVREIPRMAMILESAHNPRVSCDSIVKETDIDLSQW